MGYRVKGAAAVVEIDDGKPHLNTGVKTYLEEGAPLPANVKPKHIEHLLAIDLIEDDGEPAPKASASKTSA